MSFRGKRIVTTALRILAGLACFGVLVFQPMRANLLAAVTKQYQLNPADRAKLLSSAVEISPCDTDILNSLGDAYAQMQNATMAAINYGNAINCSPGNSLMRFKFGEALLIMGFDGRDNIEDALRLEPNHPLYKSEVERLTKPQ